MLWSWLISCRFPLCPSYTLRASTQQLIDSSVITKMPNESRGIQDEAVGFSPRIYLNLPQNLLWESFSLSSWRRTYFIPGIFPQILTVFLKKVMIRGICLRTGRNQNVSVREQRLRISGSVLWQWLTAFSHFLLSWRLSGSYHELREEETLWTIASFTLII